MHAGTLSIEPTVSRDVRDDYRFCAYRLRVLRSSPRPDAALIAAVAGRMEVIRERFPQIVDGLIS
jgi:hypothetical protein